MHDRTRYTEFGFPLANLPLPGEAITVTDLKDTVWPILAGTQILLRALGVALVTEDIEKEQANTAIALLEGHLATALHIMDRWSDARRGEGSRGGAGEPHQQPGEDAADAQG